MMYNYAQLNDENIVVGISQLSTLVGDPKMVLVPLNYSFDISLLGKKYENGEFVEGPPIIEPKIITVGAFKDRLGINALALAVSANPVCVAMREMLYDRSFVDLDRADLRSYLMMLVNNNLPEARPEFPGSGPLTEQMVDDILGAPVEIYERP